MSIAGVIAAVVRQDAPYQAEIQMGAQLIMDFAGARTGGRPYYWYRGTRYADLRKVPGWSFSRAGVAYAEDSSGRYVAFNDNEPRITDKGLLVEETRANQLLYSDDLAANWWGKTGSSVGVVNDPVYGPVARINNDSQAAIAAVTRSAIFSVDGQVVVRSALVKADGASQIAVRSATATSGSWASVGLTFATETVAVAGNAIAGGAIKGPNGWWRVWFAQTITAADAFSTGFTIRISSSATDPIGVGVLVKFAQAEVGSFLTSPIVTNGAAATRASDNASINNLPLNVLAAPSALVAWADMPAVYSADHRMLSASSDYSSNRLALERSSAGTARVVGGPGIVTGTSASKLAGGLLKGAVRHRLDGSVKAAWDNVLTAGSIITLTTDLNRLEFGYRAPGLNQLNSYIQRGLIFGDVTDAQLQGLTR